MIYLECNTDEILARSLSLPRKEIRHLRNKGEVCKRLQRSANCKGLVDEDPGSPQPRYIGGLRAVSEKYGVKHLYDEKANNSLIVLCPRLEEWILKAAEDAKADLAKYGLPEQAAALHGIRIGQEKFKQFVKSIRSRSKMVAELKRLIEGK